MAWRHQRYNTHLFYNADHQSKEKNEIKNDLAIDFRAELDNKIGCRARRDGRTDDLRVDLGVLVSRPYQEAVLEAMK